jgi:hypothetical protein
VGVGFLAAPPIGCQRLVLIICTVFAFGAFTFLAVVAYASLEDGLLCGRAFPPFGVLYFHLNPDWGRLPELLTLIHEATGQLVAGAEQVPIVLTETQIKLEGANHVGVEWANYMARLNFDA